MRITSVLAAAFGLALASGPVHAASGAPTWVGAWGYASADAGPTEELLPPGTYRYRVRLTQGGSAVQATFSNAEGDAPLALTAATIASPLANHGTEIAPQTIHALTFSGKPGAALPKGQALMSDPLTIPLANGQDVIVSVTFSTPTRAPRTNLGIEMAFSPASSASVFQPIQARSWLSLVSVRTVQAPCTVVAFGDSITDGFDSLSAETRGWPGRLAERMAALPSNRRCSVVNMGISGNRVLREGRGVSALDRFWRDVASVPNVTHVIFLEGINDIGAGGNEGADAVKPEELIHGYRQFVARAHALGIKVIGGTMTPALHAGYMSPMKEQTRLAVNSAIRSGNIFDGIVDFDAAVRNPAMPSDLRPEFDPGDHLHPNDAGLRAMGDAVDLRMLTSAR
ncbi:lysophospholipase L1-like esterase [Novosphingobium sp. PhB55]|uniref:SGNH/GDSL hydrolase family protein n=1 Tax=Novosphingobium sp. PhB55 TaxID=2485106 RepID=UPI0010669FA0|nr:SGNH/GDSL hydrolase family protein [Novosphingobium sp. PhB55]TDW61606.1 lysophospholipase L1-like esterase [Novosphingobium sp. PhB55]